MPAGCVGLARLLVFAGAGEQGGHEGEFIGEVVGRLTERIGDGKSEFGERRLDRRCAVVEQQVVLGGPHRFPHVHRILRPNEQGGVVLVDAGEAIVVEIGEGAGDGRQSRRLDRIRSRQRPGQEHPITRALAQQVGIQAGAQDAGEEGAGGAVGDQQVVVPWSFSTRRVGRNQWRRHVSSHSRTLLPAMTPGVIAGETLSTDRSRVTDQRLPFDLDFLGIGYAACL